MHSKHVIEKLGAVPDDSEDLFLKRVVSAFKDVLGEEAYQKGKGGGRKTADKKSRASSGTMVLSTDLRKVSVAFSAGPGIMQIIRQGGENGKILA